MESMEQNMRENISFKPNENDTIPPWVYSRDEDLAKIEIAVLACILTMAIFGNGVVLLVLLCRKRKLSRMNLLIVNLSFADLFVALFNVLPQLAWEITYRFKGGDELCRTVKYLQIVAIYSSSYILVMTALDRYMAICHPLMTQTWSSKRVHVMVTIAWGLSIIFSIPQAFIFSSREVYIGSGMYDCWATFPSIISAKLYVIWFTLAVWVVPFTILSICYGRICYVVWTSVNGKTNSLSESKNTAKRKSPKCNGETGKVTPRAHVRGISHAKMKTVKLTLVVILCYLICWSPFFIAQIWGALDPHAPITGDAFVILLLLASLNSCTNPWIYLAFSNPQELCTVFRRSRSAFRSSLDTSRRTKFTSMSMSTAPHTLDTNHSSMNNRSTNHSSTKGDAASRLSSSNSYRPLLVGDET
ncbi:unnamed protein product [Owenia fusiformis]|uniref:Uncharacterized protein n=1 Tax=Owenia fusiformis TaxID=6347 RepID=A0A8J1XSG6_OWEFU|nr:unnamed protein product [Owenia fusiformis]